jgi:hypothetical protein
MRREPEFFGDDADLALIYIAKKLRDAKRLEDVLASAGVDYLVEPDTYTGGIIFVTERVGAFFYVPAAGENAARELLTREGFRPYVPSGAG